MVQLSISDDLYNRLTKFSRECDFKEKGYSCYFDAEEVLIKLLTPEGF